MPSSEGVAAPTDITVLEERGDRVVVEVMSPSGRSRAERVLVDGLWRIELPQHRRVE